MNPSGVNDKGTVVGSIVTQGSGRNRHYHAFIIKNGEFHYVDDLPGMPSDVTLVSAIGIDAKDQLVCNGTAGMRRNLYAVQLK